jgi:hypothetical protein
MQFLKTNRKPEIKLKKVSIVYGIVIRLTSA